MAIRTRIQVFDRDVLFGQDGLLSEAEQSEALTEFAREQIGIVDAQNAEALGRVVPHEIRVDGRLSESLSGTKPKSVIVTEWDVGLDVVGWCYDMVREHAPVRRGRFRDSQKLYADGVEVAPEDPPAADEYVILSTVPYARKIEGTETRKPQSRQAPKGVYQVVAAMARQRYGNGARVRFGFRAYVGGSMMDYVPVVRPSARRRRAGSSPETRAKAKTERANRQPAIIITFR